MQLLTPLVLSTPHPAPGGETKIDSIGDSQEMNLLKGQTVDNTKGGLPSCWKGLTRSVYKKSMYPDCNK
jgi:hypothetical protein